MLKLIEKRMFWNFGKNIYALKCNFCNSKIKNNNPYIFHIHGLGKHNGKYICEKCLKKKI